MSKTLPELVVDACENNFKTFLTDYSFTQRALRLNDPELSCGIFPSNWNGVERSMEMGGQRPAEPTLGLYAFTCQLQVKHSEAQQANSRLMKDARVLRAVLYRSQALDVALRGLSETLLGSIERYQKRGIARQRFMNAGLGNGNVFMAITDFWIETETTAL